MMPDDQQNANTASAPAKGRRVRAAAWFAVAIGALSATAALLAGLGYRMQWWPLGDGFALLRWATFGALFGAVLALLAGGWLLLARAPRGRVTAAAALVLNALVAAPPLYLYAQAQSLPKIHDISTDTADPPAFVAVLPLRQGARNPVEYRPDTAAQQRRGYPDIAPLRLDVPPAEAFARAERAARATGWQIVAVAPEALRIEATATTLLFGFKDDVVIRIRPQAQGSVVDVRSLSRIGGSDVGANAQRIRSFLGKLAAA
jgi:uncharacterized protein (DUF1499 family)